MKHFVFCFLAITFLASSAFAGVFVGQSVWVKSDLSKIEIGKSEKSAVFLENGQAAWPQELKPPIRSKELVFFTEQALNEEVEKHGWKIQIPREDYFSTICLRATKGIYLVAKDGNIGKAYPMIFNGMMMNQIRASRPGDTRWHHAIILIDDDYRKWEEKGQVKNWPPNF